MVVVLVLNVKITWTAISVLFFCFWHCNRRPTLKGISQITKHTTMVLLNCKIRRGFPALLNRQPSKVELKNRMKFGKSPAKVLLKSFKPISNTTTLEPSLNFRLWMSIIRLLGIPLLSGQSLCTKSYDLINSEISDIDQTRSSFFIQNLG